MSPSLKLIFGIFRYVTQLITTICSGILNESQFIIPWSVRGSYFPENKNLLVFIAQNRCLVLIWSSADSGAKNLKGAESLFTKGRKTDIF